MADIKVGEELQDIASRIDTCTALVNEALVLYINIMGEFGDQYMGKASENVKLFSTSEALQIKKLGELYGKASSYVTYAYNQMNFTDKQLSEMIKDGTQSEASKNE